MRQSISAGKDHHEDVYIVIHIIWVIYIIIRSSVLLQCCADDDVDHPDDVYISETASAFLLSIRSDTPLHPRRPCPTVSHSA